LASFDLDPASGRHYIRFRYGDRPFKRSLCLEDDREATRVCDVVEETTKDLRRSPIAMPEEPDPGAF
jgi:hypothetical protein